MYVCVTGSLQTQTDFLLLCHAAENTFVGVKKHKSWKSICVCRMSLTSWKIHPSVLWMLTHIQKFNDMKVAVSKLWEHASFAIQSILPNRSSKGVFTDCKSVEALWMGRWGIPQNFGWVCATRFFLPYLLTLFQTKICNFPVPFFRSAV